MLRPGILCQYMFLLLAVSLCLSCSDKRSQNADESQTPQEAITYLTTELGIPGAALVVVNQDSVLQMSYGGVRKAGTGTPVGQGDLFHIGSMTKSMTAVLIARLVQTGELNWKTRPADVFSELNSTQDDGFSSITLLDLLRHRAGLPADEDLDTFPTFTGSLPEQRIQLAHYILSRPPAVHPGNFRYSNIGYAVAAAMAESVTGKSWRELMDSLVVHPLNMVASYGWPTEMDAAMPWGHDSTFTPISPETEDSRFDVIEPAGFLSTNVESIGKYLQFLLQLASHRSTLLNAESADTLMRPVGGYAAGLVIQSSDGQTVISHDGSNGYFYSLMILLPQEQLAVAVLVNAGGDGMVGNALNETANNLLLNELGSPNKGRIANRMGRSD